MYGIFYSPQDRKVNLKQLCTQAQTDQIEVGSKWEVDKAEGRTERRVYVTATVAVIALVSFLLLLADCQAYFLCWATAATQQTAWWITNSERESIRSAWIKTSLSFSLCLVKQFVHHRASPVLAEARGGLSAPLPSDRINKETRGNSVMSVLPAVDWALWNQTFGFREV